MVCGFEKMFVFSSNLRLWFRMTKFSQGVLAKPPTNTEDIRFLWDILILYIYIRMYIHMYIYIYLYPWWYPCHIPKPCGYHQHLQPGADQLLAAKVRVAWYGALFRGMGWLSMCLDSTGHIGDLQKSGLFSLNTFWTSIWRCPTLW